MAVETMRIFVAGASGVIGVKLVPMLVGAGHVVAGMTRTPEKADSLRMLGSEPFVGNVFEADALTRSVVAFAPDVIIHELTDLPDDPSLIAQYSGANMRIRREGTQNLLGAARASGTPRFLTQSVAWELPGEGAASVQEMEAATLAAGGVVLRYGRFYGQGTYYERQLPPPPRIHLEQAARRTLHALDAPSGILTIADDIA